MDRLYAVGRCIDRISEWSGKAAAWLCLILILELVYDTVARYVFGAPTAWSYDISYMLYGTLFMVGASYTLLLDEHVRIGVFYEKATPRGQALINVAGYLVFFFPTMLALIWFGTEFAMKSWRIAEHSGVSMWSPPIYPFKSIIPLAALLLLLQGTVQCGRSLVLLIQGDAS